MGLCGNRHGYLRGRIYWQPVRMQVSGKAQHEAFAREAEAKVRSTGRVVFILGVAVALSLLVWGPHWQAGVCGAVMCFFALVLLMEALAARHHKRALGGGRGQT
jgi:cobalamin synthase